MWLRLMWPMYGYYIATLLGLAQIKRITISSESHLRILYFFLLKTYSFITPKNVLAGKKEGHLKEFLIIHS
jgi:hypothetical protein